MEILAGLPCFLGIIAFIAWAAMESTTGVKKVGKTMRAVDKWSDKQLEDKE